MKACKKNGLICRYQNKEKLEYFAVAELQSAANHKLAPLENVGDQRAIHRDTTRVFFFLILNEWLSVSVLQRMILRINFLYIFFTIKTL